MSRTILFKAKRVDNGEWVEGYYGIAQINHGIWSRLKGNEFHSWYQVHPETVCQFTGLLDKNGKMIFEGDKFDDEEGYIVIEYDNKQTCFVPVLYGYKIYLNEGGGEEFEKNISEIDRNFINTYDLCNDEIIGNIHD